MTYCQLFTGFIRNIEFFRSPSVTKELAALVYAEDEIDLLTCPVRLVQDALVVPLRRPQALLHAQVQVELRGDTVRITTPRDIPVTWLTCVSDLRMKYRFGKYAVRMLELVDAYEPELLECGSGFRTRRPYPCPAPASSSLEIDSPAMMCIGSVGELLGVVACSDDVDADRRRAASRSRSRLSFTQRTCIPDPR